MVGVTVIGLVGVTVVGLVGVTVVGLVGVIVDFLGDIVIVDFLGEIIIVDFLGDIIIVDFLGDIVIVVDFLGDRGREAGSGVLVKGTLTAVFSSILLATFNTKSSMGNSREEGMERGEMGRSSTPPSLSIGERE